MKSESARSETEVLGDVQVWQQSREGAASPREKLIKHALWMWQQGEVHSAALV